MSCPMFGRRRSLRVKFLLVPSGIAIALGLAVTLGASQAGAAQAPIGLGSATSFAVLGGSTVTNTGPSVISGSLGVSPGSAVVGIKPPASEPGIVVNGTVHAADTVAASAQSDESTAYTVAAGRLPVTNVATELGGTTLVGGVYASDTLGLTGTLTLNGDASAVWIFKAASTLITASAAQIVLTGGASACNVFWQIGSSATLGTGTHFVGTILAHTAISAQTGATVQGRLFAQTAAVTLDTNTITAPTCTTLPASSSAPGSSGSSGTSGSGATSGSGGTSGSGATTTSHTTGGSGVGGSATHSGNAATGTPVAASRTGTNLASTGTDATRPVWWALLAIVLGGALLLAGRRTVRVVGRHRH